jgi:hypothetical protein
MNKQILKSLFNIRILKKNVNNFLFDQTFDRLKGFSMNWC